MFLIPLKIFTRVLFLNWINNLYIQIQKNQMVRENWGSRFGFIMATAGFAIGMGNIWRFPYIVGESGGGAFILVYLILTAIIGIPPR